MRNFEFHRLYSLLTAINFPFSLSSALDYSLFIISRAIHIAYIMPSSIESHSHVFVRVSREVFFVLPSWIYCIIIPCDKR